MGNLTINDFTGPRRESGGQIVFQNCPVCGSTRYKTYLNPVTGAWFCHAGEHSGGGKVDVGLPLANRGRIVRERLASQRLIEPVWHPIQLPAWEPLSRRGMAYLMARGVTESRAARLGIVEMQDRMRVVVPYRDAAGNIIYWNARSYSKMEEGPKYLAASGRHPLFVRPNWTPTDTLVLVEGIFDALAVEAATEHTVAAVGGKCLPRYLEPAVLRLGLRRVVLALDPDAMLDAAKLKHRLMTKRQVKLVVLPAGQDPADLGERVRDYL